MRASRGEGGTTWQVCSKIGSAVKESEMAYRCQSCGHFAGLDEPELEVSSEDFDGETFSVAISASYPSSCCGDEVATAEYEATASIVFDHLADCIGVKEAVEKETVEEYEIELDEPTATDRFESKDAKGKAIPFRYQRHFYGVEISGTISCESCKVSVTFEAQDESGPPDEV